MGVYIPSMETPENCSDCWMCQNSGGANELGDDFCCIGEVEIKDKSIRQASCPLVLVAPHGRLIDERTLRAAAHDVTLWNGALHRCIDSTIICELPTIIPAEEGET